MLVVGEHANSYIENYSKEFLSDFLQLLSRRWGTKRVRANQVYQEFIQDKHHTHMNSTKWVTLTGFLQYLGKNGICHVDETEKGWFISWIDNTPKALAKQDAALKKERQDLGDEERQRRMLKEQMERAKALEEEEKLANGEAEESADKPNIVDEEFDVTTIQPIKVSIGGFGSFKGKQREDSNPPAGSASPSTPVLAEAAGQTPSGIVGDEKIEGASAETAGTPQAILVSAEPASAPSPAQESSNSFKPKVNPLKMVGKPNPLKSNPLKGKPAPKLETPASALSNGKRPLSAVEAIAAEEQEKRRRREQNSRNNSSHGRGVYESQR